MLKHCIYALLLLSISCVSRQTKNFSELIGKYKNKASDSLKLQAALFLTDEIKTQNSDKPVFRDVTTGNFTNLSLDSFATPDRFFSITNKMGLEPGGARVSDSGILDPIFLEQEIETVVGAFNKYPWNNQIPKDIFLEYLLPYKVHSEYPDRWRSALRTKTAALIKNWEQQHQQFPSDPKFTSSNAFYYDLIVNTASHWFGYGSDSLVITYDPSFKELMLFKTGGCKKGSFFNTYVLRSAGIPSTVDLIPLWGSKNGSHATEVYWNNEEKKMTPGPGRKLDHPAKVIRLTFKNHHNWSNDIKPYVNEKDFLLSYLLNDYWIDATSDHTSIADVSIPLEGRKITSNIGYICVYNYGQWQPVYWGRVEDHKVTFKNMGCNVLYIVAFPSKNGLDFMNPVFLLDSAGRVKRFQANPKNRQTMKLHKLNTGAEMWVKANTSYSLYLLNKVDVWDKIAERKSLKDSVIEFKNIPPGGLYRLVNNSSNGKLERIFRYEKGQQIWY